MKHRCNAATTSSLMIAAAALIASLLLAGSADAYTVKRTSDGLLLRWWESPVVWGLDATGIPGLPEEGYEDAVVSAFGVWGDVSGTDLELEYLGLLDDEPIGYDQDGAASNVNLVAIYREGWSQDPEFLALTVTTYQSDTGEILDADILVNAQDHEWGLGEIDRTDLQNALAHEVGHVLGLGHSPEQPEATMYVSAPPGETKKRTLHPDDEDGLRALYGVDGVDEDAPTSPEDEFSLVPASLADQTPTSEGDLRVQTHCGVALGEAPAAAAPALVTFTLLLLLRGRRRPLG